jgi:predicted chitinase
MAKELKFKDDNDIGFDSGLSIPSFGEKRDKVGKGRNPVLDGIKDAGSGVVTGIWDAASSESFIKKVLKQALPDGYGAAIDTFDLAGQNLKKLYDSSEREFKPLVNDIKRTVNRLLPQNSKVMPKSLNDALKNWASTAEGAQTGMSQAQMRENNLTGTLGEVFKYQIETDAKNRAEDTARSNIKEQIDAKRSAFQLESLNSIKLSLQRLVDYQDKVTINYQRRSLELQYRQYFVQLDSFQHQRETSAQTRMLLEGIQKNTGLPDIRKIQGLGDYKDLIRNKFFNNIGSMMFGERSQFMQRIVENVQKSLAENMRSFVGQARNSIAGVEQMHEFAKTTGDMGGPSGTELTGNMVGNLVFDNFGDKLGYQLGQRVQKTRAAKHINKVGKWLDYHFGNGPQHLTELAHSKKGDNLPMGMGWLVQFAKQMVHQSNAVATGLQQDDIRNLQEPAVFNGMARKSLTEIIPGYLARIYQELQIIRTGDTKKDLMLFDPSSNRFKTAKETNLGIHKLLFKKEEVAANKTKQDELIAALEKKTGQKISPELRKDAIAHLMQLNFNNRLGTPSNLADRYAYMGNKTVKDPGALADLFAKYFGKNPTMDQLNKFQRMMNGLSYGMTDNRGLVQGLMNMGYGTNLQDMGMLTGQGNFNLDQFGKYYQGAQYAPSGMMAEGHLGSHFTRRGGKSTINVTRNNTTTNNTTHSTVNNNIENVIHNIATEIAARLHQEFTVQQPAAPSYVAPVAAATHEIRRRKFKTSALSRLAASAKASEHVTTATGRTIHKDHHDAYVQAHARVLRLANTGFGRAALKKRYPDWMPGLERFPDGAVDDEFHQKTGLDHHSAMQPRGWVAAAASMGKSEGAFGGSSQLEAVIKAASSKPVAEQILQELKKLSSGIKTGKGINVYQINGQDVGDLLQRSARRGTKFLDQSLASFGRDMYDNTMTAGKWLLNRPAAMFRMAGQGWKATKGVRDTLKLGAKKTGEKALKLASRWDDVWLPGTDEPVLEAWKLRGGYYIDEAGKAIRSWKDIKGTIRDTSMNNEVALSGSQIDLAYIKSQIGPKAIKALGAVWNFGWNNLKRMKAGVFSAIPMAIDAGKKLLNIGKNLMDQPQDIYVKGIADPVMNARTMRAGLYRSARDLNKVIHRPGDIDGPVIDTSVNPPVLALTREQLQGGIYDAMGKPIRTPFQKILNAALTPLRWLKNTAKFGFEFSLGLLKKPFEYIGKFFTNWFGPDGIVVSGSKTMVQRLTEIRDVLRDRLPKPKKIRKGSWEDLEAQAAGKVKGAASAATQNVDHGLLGKAAGVAGNVATNLLEKLGLVKKQRKPGEKGMFGKAFDWAEGKAQEGLSGWAWEKGVEKAKGVGGKVKDTLWNRVKNRLAGHGAQDADEVDLSKLSQAERDARAMRQSKLNDAQMKYHFGVFSDNKRKITDEEYRLLHEAGHLHPLDVKNLRKKGVLKRPNLKDVAKGAFGFAKDAIFSGSTAGKAGDTDSAIYKAVREGVADGMADSQGSGVGGKIGDKLMDKLGGKLGKFGKFGRMGGKVLSTVETGAKVAGKAGPLAGLAEELGLGGLSTLAGGLGLEGGGMLGTGVLAGNFAGLAGIGSAALGAATTLGGIAAAVGGGLLAVLSSPIVIGAGLLAGGIYLGSKMHSGLQSFMLHRKLGKLGFMRMAQYGFLEDDTDHINTVLEFEQLLMKHVTYDAGGRAQLDHNKLKPEEALAPFGVDMKSKTDLKNWLVWFAQRFRPVFLNSLNALAKIDKKKKLIDVDDMKKEQKAEYLKDAMFTGGPYRVGATPFHRTSFLFMHFGANKLAAGPKEVAAATAAAHKEVGDPDPKKMKKKDGEKAAVTGVKGTASSITKKDAGKKDEPTSFLGKLGEFGKKVGSGLAMAGGMLLGGGLAAMAGKWLKNEWGKISNNSDTKGMSFGDKLAVFLSPSLHHLMTGTKLHPFQALRYQAYGLHDYDQDKVAALSAMEGHLGTRLKFSGEGDKSKVEFIGDPMDVLMHFGASFDPSNVSEKGNSNAHEWLEWFMRRFLPVYLTFRGSFMKIAGFVNSVGSEPNDQQAAVLAPLVNAAKGQDGVSAWKIKSSPWPKYKLNTDPDSVSAILAFIKEKAKTKKLSDGVTKKKDGDGGKGWTDLLDGKSLKDKVDTVKSWGKGLLDKAEDLGKKAWTGIKSAATAAGNYVANTAVGKAVGKAYTATKNAVTGVAGGVGDTMKGFGASLGKAYKAVSADAGKVKDAALAALKGAGITNPTEMAMFMAQMDTESGGFKSLSENLKYSASTLMKLFGKKLTGGMAQAQQIASQGAEAVANFIYGNRMGNSAPDDGFKYRGRGIIQLTGKDNYAKYGKMLGLDLVSNPDLAADPKVAAQIAVAYWKTRVSSSAAQAGDVSKVTQEINGGQNGLASRQQNFQKYLQQAKAGQLQPSGASPDDKKQQQASASGNSTTGVTAPGAKNATAGALPTGGPNAAVAAATAPASSTGSGAGSSTPTVAATGTALPTPSVTSTASSINKTTSAPATPSGGDGTSLGSPSPFGFNMASAKSTTPPAKSILAVQQAQHEDKMSAMGGMNDVLSKSLEVQTDARDILKTIAAAVQQLQKAGGTAADEPSQSATSGGNAGAGNGPKSSLRGQRQPMPTPPVSMLNEV